MAFESLTDKLSGIIKKIKGHTRLTSENMDEILKEIRVALLEADVNYRVVKEFINEIKEKAIGEKVYDKLNPSEMVVKIVRDELVNILGSGASELNVPSSRPCVILMAGLQGSGKTTTAAKLANFFKNKEKKRVLLAACDIYRPGASEQLETLAKSIGVEIITRNNNESAESIARRAKERAFFEKFNYLIIDTAGRLQIDETLMNELENIKNENNPDEVLLLVDASSGQDAVNVAQAFNEKIGITGVVMSKMDGDARGGAAISIKKLTNVPIKFIGVGEKVSELEKFYPERMAERILGMGDILTLVEKAASELDEKEVKKGVGKMLDGNFGLDDMLAQMKQVKKLGSLSGILKMIPGMPKISAVQQEKAENEMKLFEVIINSMTPEERRHPEILKFSRKQRIAKGSGRTPADINRVIKKYEQSKEMMKQMNRYKKSGKFPTGGFPGMF